MKELEFIKFEHWLEDRDQDNNWITVSQDRKFIKNDMECSYFTISIIVDAHDLKTLMSDHDWLTDVQFGNQQVWKSHNEIKFYSNSFEEKDGMKIKPFVILREWEGKSTNSKFELIQDFILFYNLYSNEQEQIYKAIKETGEELDVVKVTNQNNCKKIEIRNDFLKNYLNFKNKILVRQHDHRADINKELSEYETNHIRDDHNFKLIIDRHLIPTTEKKSHSRLFGKDMIRPSKTKKHLLGEDKKYLEFIIGLTEDGDEIKETCNEEKIGNHSEKTNAHYNTPVFFKREVLKKYQDTLSTFTVHASHLSCGNFWHLPIAYNSKDLVYTCLGDLGHIPYNEQKHWSEYNVRPERDISQSKYDQDFDGIFSDPDDLMFKFKKSLSKFQKTFLKKYGFMLFKPLGEKDKHVENGLRIPANDEQCEFEIQILFLAKILPDSINVKELKNEINYKKEDKSIKNLERFFGNKKIESSLITELHKIQQIRSAGVAHRKGEYYEKVSPTYNLDLTSHTEFFKDLIQKLIDSFEDFNNSSV